MIEDTNVSMETAIAMICRKYELNENDVLEMFKALDCVTPEQRTRTIITCTAFAVKDMIDNKISEEISTST